MKNNKSPQPAEAQLQVRQGEDGRWTWRYVEPETGVELDSNESFASRESAVDWARRAYPDLPFADDEAGG